ncbi:unnamed protein product [Linum trigynum]|uniref:Uncharacterized protein n=1 Tax=Linum trigynum TaxID=586398 RepID=A0AAV2FCM0_9ROSI
MIPTTNSEHLWKGTQTEPKEGKKLTLSQRVTLRKINHKLGEASPKDACSSRSNDHPMQNAIPSKLGRGEIATTMASKKGKAKVSVVISDPADWNAYLIKEFAGTLFSSAPYVLGHCRENQGLDDSETSLSKGEGHVYELRSRACGIKIDYRNPTLFGKVQQVVQAFEVGMDFNNDDGGPQSSASPQLLARAQTMEMLVGSCSPSSHVSSLS